MAEIPVEPPIPFVPDTQAAPPPPEPGAAAPVPFVADAGAPVAEPVDFLANATAQELADSAIKNPGTFDLTSALAPRKDLRSNPAMMDKFAEAHGLVLQSPWYKGLPGAEKIGENAFGVVKGMWESGVNLAEATTEAAAAELARAASDPNDPYLRPEIERAERDVQKRFLEAGAAAEGGLTGIVRQGMSLLLKPGHTLAKAAGIAFPALRAATDQIAKGMPDAPEQLTHQAKLASLHEKLAQADQSEEITKGHGSLNTAIGSEVLKDIEAHGQAVDPEKVARMEAGEPFSWYAFGKAMKPFHVAASSIASVTPGLNVIAGRTIQGTAIAAKPVIKVGLPAAGAAAGATAGHAVPGLAGVTGAIPGAATIAGAYYGLKAGQKIEGSVSGVLERTAKIGSELAGAPTSNAYTIAARNTLKNAPRVLRPVAEGAAMDLGIAATADTPAERQGVGLGLAFGLVGAAKAAPGAAWKTFTGQLIDPRSYSSGTPLPSSGRYAALDAAHNAAFDKMSPAQRGIVNATRFLLRGTGESTDLFAIPADEGLVKDLTTKGLTEKQARERAEDVAIEQALTASGMEAGQAKFAASQRAGAIEMPDGKQIIFLRGTDTLPAGHEARHVIEKSLGEDFLKDFDSEIISRYGLDAVMEAAQRYGQQVGGGGDWVENIINASGKGELEAVTKLVAEMRATADAGRKTRGEPPTLPGNDKLAVQELMANRAKFQAEVAGRMQQQGLTRAEAITTIVNRYRAESGATGLSNEGLADSVSNLYRHWTEILSPEEKTAAALRYTAREIGAENFSAWFARTGGDLTAGKQIPDRIANWIAGGLDEFGINALAGEGSTGSTPVELNFGVAKKTGEQALSKQGGKRPVIEPAGAKSSEPSTADAVAKGREVIAGAPDEKLPGATQSIKEMLGTLVQAIADKAAVIVNYRSAPGQPAAGSVVEGLTQGMDRDARRAIVDAWRYMPEATRNLVERIFSPEEVRNTSKGYQVYGASPQVVAANAQKLAETALNHSSVASRMPAEYELSRSMRSFTRNGWKALLTDIADYSQNHSRGYTGSGERLNVPQSVTAKDYFAPPVTGEPVKIPQERADVVATLFGYHTPENAIVTKAGKLPLNIVGQRISEATIPGRTTGKKAQFGAPELSIEQQNRAKSLGIEWQTLAENNPFVQKLSNLANPPQFIEAKQWMNLEHMADVTAAPEQPRLAQNTLTAAAGFMTKVAAAGDLTSKDAFRQFMAKTEAGKVLEERGFKLERSHNQETGTYFYDVMPPDGKDSVATMEVHYDKPGEAKVGYVVTESAYRGKGIAETLYRELATDLQEQGITKLTGDVIHPAPMKIRDTLFGNTQRSAPKDNGWGASFYKVSNEIAPGVQFMAKPNEPKAVKTAAVKDLETGKVYTGAWHVAARNEWAIDKGIITRDMIEGKTDAVTKDGEDIDLYTDVIDKQIKDGFETNAGEFLDRDQAYTRAMELKQIVKEDYENQRGANQWLESGEFAATRKFMAKERDAEYLKAVESGDDQSAQRMVDAAARDAGYTAQGFHGTDAPVFHVFKTEKGLRAGKTRDPNSYVGAHFASSVLPAKRFADGLYGAKGGRVIRAYLKISRPLQVGDGKPSDALVSALDAQYRKAVWDYTEYDRVRDRSLSDAQQQLVDSGKIDEFVKTLRDPKAEALSGVVSETIRAKTKLAEANRPVTERELLAAAGFDWDTVADRLERLKGDAGRKFAQEVGTAVRDYLLENGYDGVRYRNAYEEERGVGGSGETFIALHPEQIKAADAITRDAEGNAIPLSERFNAKNSDMRYMAKAKGKDDYKLPIGRGTFSKAWILPNGRPVMLGGTWHHDYLNENAAALKKEHGLKLTTDGQDNRLDALRAGFVRVNYDKNKGALVVEATQAAWPKVKDSVLEMVKANLPKIDVMEVSLFDKAAKRVVESDAVKLFTYDDAEKLDHIPLITERTQPTVSMSAQASSEGGSFMTKYSHQTLKDDIQKVNEGAFEGQTYNVDGTAWEAPAGAKNDIVTLASKNFAQEDLTLAKVRSYLKPFYRFLEDPAAKFGLFPFTDKKTGAKMVSADVNAVVPQKYRDNSVKFAKDNDQIAIFDAVTLENVNTGGAGNTKITREGEMLDATNLLIKGKPVSVADVIKQNADAAAMPEEQALPGIDVPKSTVNTGTLAKMTKMEIKEHFPESVVPRARDEKIQSEILDSPLFKSAKSRAEAVKKFAAKLVSFAREYQHHPAYLAGLKWYSEFVPKLHATYGKLAPIMAELLAATSPNEKPTNNFKMANEALVLLNKGAFDKQIAKFEQGLDMIKSNTWRAWLDKEAAAGKVKLPSDPTAATFINHWYDAHDIAPKKSNGKLFGMNSQAVMKVFARDWLQNTDGPKTQNFVQNLLGTGHEATIDVWADRTMRRMGYSGFKDRWRILPANGAGVSDADFAFGQEAFRAAAKEMGVLPDALQGALWFAEKKLWNDNGWGQLDLGSYQAEFKKVPALNRIIEGELSKKAPPPEDLFVVPRTVKPK